MKDERNSPGGASEAANNRNNSAGGGKEAVTIGKKQCWRGQIGS